MTPVIAGGLVETKAEVTAALKAGAMAVSTGKPALWSM
jgi:glycerol uptake operon antiterminator